MIESSLVFSTERNLFTEIESKYGSSHIRQTIDGRCVGCSKCVGFCQFDGHPGFLTSEQRKKHDCLGKNCFYYVPKPARAKKPLVIHNETQEMLSIANESIDTQEGVRFLDAVQCEFKKWNLGYITITNDYSLTAAKEVLEKTFNCEVVFSRKHYSYDRCIQLLFGA